LSPSAGEIWLADRDDERRRVVFVISDDRFQRLAERAVVAPVLDEIPEPRRPWQITFAADRVIAVNQLAILPVERLLERVGEANHETLRRVRHAVLAIAG
jgi:mRNA-degrading endonuclease toxin of MazEF toxin-antitoxin module